MAEHIIPHNVIHFDEEGDNMGHDFCFILIHQFVAYRENVFEEKLFFVLIDFFDHRLQLVNKVDAGFGERV